MNYNAERLAQAKELYTKFLAIAVEETPEKFFWKPESTVTTVSDAMWNSIAINGVKSVRIVDSFTFKRTAYAIGIKNTFKAWDNWLKGENSV